MELEDRDLDSGQKFQKHLERLPSVVSEHELEDVETPSKLANINKHLLALEDDYLYHISLGKKINDLKKMFSDVKFVCMGGSPKRMLQFALYIKDVLSIELPTGLTLQNISEPSDRYCMYKIGPVISVNHGIGCPSMSILLHELIKLVHYAGCTDVTFFRIGTSGGIGVEPGTLVVTSESVDGLFRPEYRQLVLGKEVIRPTNGDSTLVDELLAYGKAQEAKDHVKVISGKTLCAHDFYEGQGRLDGAFCEYSVENKFEFLHKCHENNVKNIEMESLCFLGLLNHAKIRAGVVCVTLVDRLNGDQVAISHDLNIEFQERPFKMVANYIKSNLNKNNKK